MAESLGTLLHAAYMMEQVSLHALKERLGLADDQDVLARFKAHIVETRWQASLVKACMEFQEIHTGAHDGGAVRLVGKMKTENLFELKRFEIDLYKRVISFVRTQYAPEVLQACREILEQEVSMMEWIEDNHFKIKDLFSAEKRLPSSI